MDWLHFFPDFAEDLTAHHSTMHKLLVVFLSTLLPVSLCHQSDPFAWLYGPRSHQYASLQAGGSGWTCPEECDCPPTFPVAMYCNGRGLTAMPAIPSHVKYLYLQNNAITAVSDSALDNATSLVWLMMHHNQLTSDAVGKKVKLERQGHREPHVWHRG